MVKEYNDMSKCTQCPHVIVDSYERDCAFPECIGWTIEKNVKPIPDRSHDYDFWHKDYDGADGGNGLAGTAASIIDAMNEITQIEIVRILEKKDDI